MIRNWEWGSGRTEESPLAPALKIESSNAIAGSKKPAVIWRVCEVKIAINQQRLNAIVADCFHRASLLGFLAKRFLLGSGGLLENVGIPAVVVASKVRGRGFAAQVAINALIVHVIFSGRILGVSVCNISHTIKSRMIYGAGELKIQEMFLCGACSPRKSAATKQKRPPFRDDLPAFLKGTVNQVGQASGLPVSASSGGGKFPAFLQLWN
jgi:hypothetical protein